MQDYEISYYECMGAYFGVNIQQWLLNNCLSAECMGAYLGVNIQHCTISSGFLPSVWVPILE